MGQKKKREVKNYYYIYISSIYSNQSVRKIIYNRFNSLTHLMYIGKQHNGHYLHNTYVRDKDSL